MNDNQEVQYYQEQCEQLKAKLADTEAKCACVLEDLREANNRVRILEAQVSMVELIFGGGKNR